jgi:hypothetical protein
MFDLTTTVSETLAHLRRSLLIRRWTTPLLITLAGCGGATQEPTKSALKSEPASKEAAEPKQAAPEGRCAKSKRTGTYHVQLQGISSSCPSIPDFDVQWDSGEAALESGCTLDKPDKWSGDGCSVQHLVTCEVKGGGTTKMVMVSSPESDDGSIYAGVVSIKKLDASGTEKCQGTFRLIASRS